MNFEIFLILFFIFWLVVFNKKILFWVWLWQLKEYHWGRFRAHFQTHKGKRLILNWLNFLKFALILFPFLFPFLFPHPRFDLFFFYILAIFFIFFFEGGKVLLDIKRKTLKIPVLTKKTALIIFVGIFFEVSVIYFLFFHYQFYYFLLIIDFFSPLIVTFFVAIVHPWAIFWRRLIIRKAKEKRSKFKNLIVIGITGSYGKTSTKEFLATILSEKYRVLKTKEHQNSEVGISQCILNDLKPDHEIFVVEMGAYNKGGIKLLGDIANPKIGIVTGVNEQHLATFGSMENLLSAEGGRELIESLPKDGVAFFNGKNKYCRDLYQKTKIKKFLYGQNAPLLLENLEGAKLVAKELGMREEEIERGCQKIENKLPGIEIKKTKNGLTIIDATYSANPTGTMTHLEYIKNMPGKKIMVMPCLIELGKASKEIHRKIGQKIGQVCDLAIICTKEFFREISKEAKEKAILIENPKAAFEKIIGFCSPGDVVLLEGRVSPLIINWLIKNKNFSSKG